MPSRHLMQDRRANLSHLLRLWPFSSLSGSDSASQSALQNTGSVIYEEHQYITDTALWPASVKYVCTCNHRPYHRHFSEHSACKSLLPSPLLYQIDIQPISNSISKPIDSSHAHLGNIYTSSARFVIAHTAHSKQPSMSIHFVSRRSIATNTVTLETTRSVTPSLCFVPSLHRHQHREK